MKDLAIEQMNRAIADEELNKEDFGDYQLKRLYDWLMDEKREPAKTKFTSGMLRNVAAEIEFKLKNNKP